MAFLHADESATELRVYRGTSATGGALYRFGAPLITPQALGTLVAWDGERTQALAVGSNGQVLTADSSETTGVKWATPDATPWADGDVLPDTDNSYDIGSATYRWQDVYAYNTHWYGETLWYSGANTAGFHLDSSGRLDHQGTGNIRFGDDWGNEYVDVTKSPSGYPSVGLRSWASQTHDVTNSSNFWEVKIAYGSTFKVTSTQITNYMYTEFRVSDAATNTVLKSLAIRRGTSATAANGIGAGQAWDVEDSAGSWTTAGYWETWWTDATNHDSSTRMRVKNNNSYVDSSNLFVISGESEGVGIGVASASIDAKLHVGGTAHITGNCELDADINHDGSNIGVFGTAPTTKQTVTGSRAGNAALASLLTALAAYGLVTDSSSA